MALFFGFLSSNLKPTFSGLICHRLPARYCCAQALAGEMAKPMAGRHGNIFFKFNVFQA
jgi:hypothetical protein